MKQVIMIAPSILSADFTRLGEEIKAVEALANAEPVKEEIVMAKEEKSEEKVEEIDKEHFIISTNQPPVRGLANKAILKLLSGHFSVPLSMSLRPGENIL